ncbi:MAG TPA: putative maltokinase, partial [Acidocella sp.]|uniref:putative maltokinase n=1 Tax=Acidocella sp. TaxID=50710 RepID=UPI002C2C9774
PWHVRPSEPLPELATLVLRTGLSDVLEPAARKILETEALPAYLQRRRWFAAKDQKIVSAKLARGDKIPGRSLEILLTELEVQLSAGRECYLLPLGISWDGDTSSALPQQLALARVRQGRRMGYLTDAFAVDAFPLGVIRALRAGAVVNVQGGEIICRPSPLLAHVELPAAPEVRRLSAEQSNSSIIVGQKIILKLLRRVMDGLNPEVEMMRHLTEAGYANSPKLLGEVALVRADGSGHSMIVAQEFVQNQGDAWQYTQNYLARFIETMGLANKDIHDEADQLSGYASFARSVGTRLADLHAVFARPNADPAFAPERADDEDAAAWGEDAAAQLSRAFDALQKIKSFSSQEAAQNASFILDNRHDLLDLIPSFAAAGKGTLRTRIHGDFHLGQVLVSTGDVYIIDFEGEPAKKLEIRRAKASPLRDVAGLLRSFDYAASVAAQAQPPSVLADTDAPLARFVADMSEQFLASYRAVAQQAAPRWVEDDAAEAALRDLFLLEKVAYELCYEAANRPDWLWIPLRGFAVIIARLLHITPRVLQDA